MSPEFTEEQTGTEGPVVHCLQSVLAMENHQNDYSSGAAPIDDFLAAALENDIGVALNTVLVVPIEDGKPSRYAKDVGRVSEGDEYFCRLKVGELEI